MLIVCVQRLEKDLIGILNKVSKNNIFQKKLSTDVGELKKRKNIFVEGDKTKTLYVMSPRVYRKSVSKCILQKDSCFLRE